MLSRVAHVSGGISCFDESWKQDKPGVLSLMSVQVRYIASAPFFCFCFFAGDAWGNGLVIAVLVIVWHMRIARNPTNPTNPRFPAARFPMPQHKLRGLREQAVEEAIRLGGYQTLPLGRDRGGRFYFRFPGDARRVFVSHAARQGEEESLTLADDREGKGRRVVGKVADSGFGGIGGGGGGGAGGSRASITAAASLLPRNPAPEDLMVYENNGDLDALMGWLNESGQREGPLRAALLRAFPPSRSARGRSPSPMDVDSSPPPPPATTTTVSDGGTGRAEAAAGVKQEDVSSVAATTEEEDGLEAKPPGEEGEAGAEPAAVAGSGEGLEENGEGKRGEEEAVGAMEATATATTSGGGGGRGRRGRRSDDPNKGVLARPSKNHELPQMLQEGRVELRITMPPGASGNVLVPVSEAVVEFDNDGEVDEVREGPGGGWGQG